jgi:hypothetical protein
MLQAVLHDAAQLPDARVTTLLAPGVAVPVPANVTVVREPAAYHRAVAGATVLAIAPETAGILAEYAEYVPERGGDWLGCTPHAIRLTSDKLALAAHWQQHGIPTPACTAPTHGPVVIKPQFGCGAVATFRRPTPPTAAELADLQTQAQQPLLVQPDVPGHPASVALLVGPQSTLTLPAAAQHITAGTVITYEGGHVPLSEPEPSRAQHLARAAVACVPGLAGWVGVDLILGATDFALEINPRLTTSYVGLRALTPDNLLAAWLAVRTGQKPTLRWHSGMVTFTATGVVSALCG